MGVFGNISIVASLLLLSACGEPLNQSDVRSKFSGYTVSELTSEQRYLGLGPNDPSLGMRFIYHASDGRAYYFKETPKGYRRQESGRWWVGENEICYSMRATRAEDVDGGQCAPAGTVVLWSSFERGDTRRLAPQRTPVTNSQTSSSQSGEGVDCTWNLACAIRNTSGGDVAAAVVLGGFLAMGRAAENAPVGGYPNIGSGAGQDSSTTTPQDTNTSATSSSGYIIFDRIQYGPGQDVIARGRCNNGRSFNVRYYPNNGKKYAIYSQFGSSVDDVAGKFCN